MTLNTQALLSAIRPDSPCVVNTQELRTLCAAYEAGRELVACMEWPDCRRNPRAWAALRKVFADDSGART